MSMVKKSLAILSMVLLMASVLAGPAITFEPTTQPNVIVDTVQPFHAPRVPAKDGTSQNWSGYAVPTPSQAVTNVAGTWVMPTVTASAASQTYSAAWVGIDGYNDGTVEQTGTAQNFINGQASYYAWFEMYPKPSYELNPSIYPVSPGDAIVANVTYVGHNQFVLTLKDTTKGWTFSTTQKSNGYRQSAEWIMEAPSSGSVLPLANFGTINFTGSQATISGVTGSISTWPNYSAITMATSSGTTKAAPSALSPDGSSFSVTWYSN